VGNREDLLAAAKQCLLDRGYSRTSVRDIATAAGVSMAAIGYHFGSKEALLNAAFMEAMADWAADLRTAAAVDPRLPPAERFEAIWGQLIHTFDRHRRIAAVSLEMYAQIGQLSRGREALARMLHDARLGLGALFGGFDPQRDEERAWLVGSLYHALMSGVFLQWLTDPADALSAKDLTAALRLALGGDPDGPAVPGLPPT